MARLLLLGGTADARRLTDGLHQQGVELIYSIAGKVRTPKVDCQLVVGGFSQFGGLAPYIQQQNICAVLDMTHPYAAIMSSTAVSVCRELALPCWRFDRPAWQQQPGDQWLQLDDWCSLPQQLAGLDSVLLTAGQLSETLVFELADVVKQLHLRTAVQPAYALPESVNWIKAIGPFSLADEQQLFSQLQVQALVSKNSGGESTVAKLAVARDRQLPVYMLKRPAVISADQTFTDLSDCQRYVRDWWQHLG